MSDDKLKSRDAEIRQLIECLSRIGEWADTYGASLKPSAGSADTFGDGMRKAKQEIKDILSKVAENKVITEFSGESGSAEVSK